MHPLAKYRAEHNLTQSQFAELVGTTQVSVARWEAGTRTPRPAHARKIKEITGGIVTADDFIGEANAAEAEGRTGGNDDPDQPAAPRAA